MKDKSVIHSVAHSMVARKLEECKFCSIKIDESTNTSHGSDNIKSEIILKLALPLLAASTLPCSWTEAPHCDETCDLC